MPLSRKKGNQAEGAARAKAPLCGSLPGMFEDGEKARTVSWEKQDGGTEVSGSRRTQDLTSHDGALVFTPRRRFQAK